jgi:hypothetical protein
MLGRLDEGAFMTTTIIRRAYWGVLTMVLMVIFSISLFAQPRPVAASTSASPVARDLNSTLVELLRVAPATNQDLDYLQQHSGRLHWVTFWRGDKADKTQMTTALRRNLQFAVPNLIHDAQASGGSISTTFELYKDLAVVCESLDSLLPPGSREGNRDSTALSNDLSDMSRLQEELSSYIKRTAASTESKNQQVVSSSGTTVKRIVVDDTTPEKPAPKKRRASNQ